MPVPAHSWAVEEKAWGCRQEPAVHIERLCGLMHSKSLCTEISPAFHSRLVHIFSLCYSILLWVWSRPPVQEVLTILAFGILLVFSCLCTNSLYRSVLSFLLNGLGLCLFMKRLGMCGIMSMSTIQWHCNVNLPDKPCHRLCVEHYSERWQDEAGFPVGETLIRPRNSEQDLLPLPSQHKEHQNCRKSLFLFFERKYQNLILVIWECEYRGNMGLAGPWRL